MRLRIQENLKKNDKRTPQFIEKDFENKDTAQKYAKKFCKSWKNITIKEV